ncbi:hypothetical protein MMC07_000390 [Pseudocyphellaria aurata]|nr:hypothetical protein [Pseudocyphellaria aurata]
MGYMPCTTAFQVADYMSNMLASRGLSTRHIQLTSAFVVRDLHSCMQYDKLGCWVQYEVPPRDLQVKVIVKEELGEVVLSVGPTYLTRGSVHSLPRHEIERFLRSGQLEILDLNRD